MSIVSRNRPPFGDDGEAIIFVGEVATVGFRLTDANGAVQSYAGRTFGLQVYLDGGTNKINVNGALTSHADGDYIQCALTEDETDLLTAGTLYGWGFVEYTADGPIVVCGGVVRAAAGATAAQASGAPGSGIGGITLYTLRIDTGIVTVTYMGAPGAGVLPGGTDGQFLVKDGASDYSTEWVTLGITHVSGLSTSLSTLTAADVSLTSRLSTEETTRASADTSLTTRLSTEEATRGTADTSIVTRFSTADTSLQTRVSTEEAARAAGDTSLQTRVSTEEATRASADTSLATAAAATYLPLAGGTMAGVLAVIAGTAALPGLAVAGDLDTGIYGVSANVLGVSAGGLNAASFSNGQLSLATAAGGAGVNLAADAANTLALRNGANAQNFRVYNTYTDASNYERAGMYWTGNVLYFGTEAAGTGTGQSMRFVTAGSGSIIMRSGGSDKWSFLSDGRLVPSTANTYDIGSSSTSARSIYAGTSIEIGGSAPSGSSSLTSFGRNWSLLGSASLGDATTKVLRIGLPHYTNAEEPLQIISGAVTSSGAEVYIGGSSSLGNAATAVYIYTAADNTTTTGTARWYWDGTGNYRTIADATYDIGRSGAGRPNNIYAAGTVTAGVISASQGLFTSAIAFGASSDAILLREAANTLALRNSTNAQAFRVYNTYTDASNYERLSLGYSGGDFRIATEQGGGGSARSLMFATGNTNRWFISGASGSLFTNSDNTYDIGAAGANRARNIYAANAFVAGGGIDAGSRVYIYTGTPIPAGGTTGAGYRMSSTANFGVFFGSGAPTLSAAKGSLYLRSDGSGTSDRMYVNTDGGTTWTAVTTAT